MDVRIEMLVQACLEELRIAYDEAFAHLRGEVRLWNAARTDGGPRLGELKGRVDAAERVYRETRDELADYIIAQQPKTCAAACCR